MQQLIYENNTYNFYLQPAKREDIYNVIMCDKEYKFLRKRSFLGENDITNLRLSDVVNGLLFDEEGNKKIKPIQFAKARDIAFIDWDKVDSATQVSYFIYESEGKCTEIPANSVI